MPRHRCWITAVLLAALSALWLSPVAGGAVRARAAGGPVPPGFVGMVADGPLFPGNTDLAHQLDVMVASGVQTVRIEIDWASAQPYQSWNKVPADQQGQFVDVGGVPTAFGPIDQLVALAAQRRLSVLPDVLNAPAWDRQRFNRRFRGAVVAIPQQDGPYASFMKALVRRYGPKGSFWQGQPTSPIRMWQVWNEPDLTPFWPAQPFEARYLALLRAAHSAIKSADPGAKVVLAGLTNYSWKDLARIYSYRGARNLFDVVGVHPYTRDAGGVITILNNVRGVMNKHGDAGKPMMADEISWPSSLGKNVHYADFVTTPAGQAQKLAHVLPLLAKNRARLRLMAFYYYTWVSLPNPRGPAFTYSGLFNYTSGRFVAKPAYSSFRRGALALEHCREKGANATVCL